MFKDKNGNEIIAGQTLSTHIDRDLFDRVVIEENGKLGLFNRFELFVPLDTLHDEFFAKCEILSNVPEITEKYDTISN